MPAMSPTDTRHFGAIARLDRWNPRQLAIKTKWEREFIQKYAKDRSHNLKNKTHLKANSCAEAGSHIDCAFTHMFEDSLVAAAKLGARPESTQFSENAVVNNGLTDINNGWITSGLATPYTNANMKIGVGDTTGATVLSDVDLHAAANAANRWTQAVDATYPTVALGVVTSRATFATGNANFHWFEWVISNGSLVGATALTRILNRAATDLLTKTSAQAWQFTPTITLA